MSFRDILGKRLIIADGAMGTQLQAAGLALGEAPINWNLSHPDVVSRIHRDYLEAGASLLTTNTFTAGTLILAGQEALAKEIIETGVTLATEAVKASGHEAFVALDIGPLGRLLEPLGDLAFDTAADTVAFQIEIGETAGADLILIETMIDAKELRAALTAARRVSDLPVVASVALNNVGRMLDGTDISSIAAVAEELGADAIGINCGAGPMEVAPFIEEFSKTSGLPLVLNPNAGMPIVTGDTLSYPVEASEYAALMEPLVLEYAAIAGGCCGTTPAHIKALAECLAQTAAGLDISNRVRQVG